MKIAIITVDYNNHEDTLELLKSLERVSLKGFEVQIIVVDNGSQEPLSRKGIHIPVEILQTGINKGFAGGYNHGIRYALNWGADYILIINNDTFTSDKNLLHAMIKEFKSNPRAGIVVPKILFAPGYEFHKDRYSENEIGKVIWYAGGFFDWNNVAGIHIGIDEVDRGQYDNVEKTEFVTGCCFMAKSEVFEKIGLLKEELFAYFEDVEFINKVKQQYDLIYTGKASIYHKVSRTAGIGSPLTEYLTTRNRLYFGMESASNRTRFALLRESVKFLLWGRPMQKKGTIDYYLQKKTLPDQFKPGLFKIKYPTDLSIVITHYKTLDLTINLLNSIFNKTSGFDTKKHEVIVVDNGSKDGIEKVLKKYPSIKFIQNSENLGFAKGNNQGIDYSKGKYILLLNSDTIAHKESFKNIVKAGGMHKEQAVIAGKLILPDGTIQKSCFNLPTIYGAVQEYFLGKKGSYAFFAPSNEKHTRVEGAVMACFLIPRKIINSIGKLSEESFLYFEDIEYCRRIMTSSYKIYYAPEVEFDHIHGASSNKLKSNEAYDFLKKGARFYHGEIYYKILTGILWLGQKLR